MSAKSAIELSILCRGGRFATRNLAALLWRILRMIGVTQGVWSIVLVRDAEMKELHRRHLGIDTTTDVLTFDMGGGGGEMRNAKCGMRKGVVELESVICLDEARRRAAEMGHSVGDEVLLYAVHSLLHVMGYDDVTAAGARRMHAREDEILRAVGVGAVYEGKRETGRQPSEGGTTNRRAVSGVGR